MALRVVLSGATGRMGGTLRRLIEDDPELELVGGLDRDGETPPEGLRLVGIDGAGELLAGADALIDFSAPAFLRALLERQADAVRGKALLVGTTGLEDAEQQLLDRVAADSPVLTAANFSVAVNLLLVLVEQAARVLGPEYDVEIVETHHRRKEDAPSGTALPSGRRWRRGGTSSFRRSGAMAAAAGRGLARTERSGFTRCAGAESSGSTT